MLTTKQAALMEKEILTSFGYVLKEEKLTNVDYKILPNTFVLENEEPFPGYNGLNIPDKKAPESVFLITKSFNPKDEIYRVAHRIKKNTSIIFDADPGWLHIYNDQFPCIRLHNLSDYETIAEIQSAFNKDNIQLAKYHKIKTTGIIRVFKFFRLEQIESGIYLDSIQRNNMYFEIPNYLKWRSFEKLNNMVKNNVINRNFDAAQAAIFWFDNIKELVRIFRKEPDIKLVMEIRDKYFEFLKEHKNLHLTNES